ncbi:unnamed protein product, partial [Iphiclides podalirius]
MMANAYVTCSASLVGLGTERSSKGRAHAACARVGARVFCCARLCTCGGRARERFVIRARLKCFECFTFARSPFVAGEPASHFSVGRRGCVTGGGGGGSDFSHIGEWIE